MSDKPVRLFHERAMGMIENRIAQMEDDPEFAFLLGQVSCVLHAVGKGKNLCPRCASVILAEETQARFS